jgi:hypothetical protein
VSAYFNQLASRIVNVDHSIMRPAVVFGVFDCVYGFQVPQPAERQRVRDQIKAAMIVARANFLNVHWHGFPLEAFPGLK